MIRKYLIAAAMCAVSAFGVQAQTIGLATTKGGATEQIATALAKTITDTAGLMVRPQVMANTSQYLPLVDSGRVEFGVANFPQTANAVTGTGMSEGQPNPNLRMVASLIPFNAGLMVTDKSAIKDMAGLKGRKVPRFPPNSLGDFFFRASLATAGLTYDDVTSVPMANFPAMFEAFKDGTTEVTIATVGSQTVFDMEASLGPVSFLNFKAGDDKVLAEILPGTMLKTWGDRPLSPGIKADSTILFYDYTLFVNKDVPDEVVGKVAKALFEGKASLQASGPLWSEFDPAKLAHVQTLDYHPGAVAFYKSAGIWAGK